jgi:dTDP-4-amino-4,6-dideoxygalactose transaminase
MPIPFGKPHFSPAARRQIADGLERMLSSGQLMLGEFTQKLEDGFASYVGTSSAVSTNSCTTALQICLLHYDVKGREVLVPSAGFITDISVIRWAGGTPVLVDTNPDTLSFDLADLARKLTPKTKGIIWVHLTGLISPQWHEIVAFAREHGLFLIEDCAHAHGASVDGRKAWSIGDVGCFSFYPTKVMTAGTGGVLVTSDADLVRDARELRLFGRRDGVGHVWPEGNDWFLDEIRACVAYYQLCELDDSLRRRREIARRYDEKLAGVPGFTRLHVPAGHQPSYYHYTVFLDPGVDYAKVSTRLKEKHGIPTKPIYVPLHQEPVFRDLDTGTLTKTEDVLARSLCLPLFVDLADEDVDRVAQALAAELRGVECATA